MIFLSIILFSCKAPNPSCQNFKTGVFEVKTEGDSDTFFKIERNGNSQIETNEFNDKVYYSIKWISNCSYIQKFDENKMELTDEMKMINEDGGLVIELLNVIDENCIYYQSYVKKFKDLSLKKGIFCKIE